MEKSDSDTTEILVYVSLQSLRWPRDGSYLRDRSLITGGGASEVLPLCKGGGGGGEVENVYPVLKNACVSMSVLWPYIHKIDLKPEV